VERFHAQARCRTQPGHRNPHRTAGATVHLYFINKAPYTQVGAYVTDVLNQIGYHATLTLEDNYQAGVYDPNTRPVNIGGQTWVRDFPRSSISSGSTN
jgi:hypothetical protein